MIQTQLIYCGDNLLKLRELPDECVDLIYIDPPFNSNRNYEVFWGDTKEKRSFEDRFGAVEHYIHWMRPRVMELHRVLKKSGSFYYHCDTNANAYVRIMLDQIFGFNAFRNEIIWKRSDTHNDAKFQFPDVADSIFLYSPGKNATFHPQRGPHAEKTLSDWYQFLELPDGTTRRMTKEENETLKLPEGARRFNADNMASPNPRPNLMYEYKGFPHPLKGWRYSKESMEELDRAGLLIFPKEKTGRIMRKRYLDEQAGVVLGNIWTDIPQIRAHDAERLGYPTQKPLALMNRIISASSNKGDVVLDAFCGCGTTLEAAQHLGRRWIGIDVSPTSCRVMATRLADRCYLKEGKDFWVRDLPKTAEELRKYPPFEFENWAVNALNTVIANGHAIANRAQVGDMGIDGRIYPATHVKEKTKGYDLFGESDRWYPVQVKQKDKAGRPDIDSFETAMQRQGRTKGFFVSFGFTGDAEKEIKRAAREMNLEIIPITVQEILEEEILHRV